MGLSFLRCHLTCTFCVTSGLCTGRDQNKFSNAAGVRGSESDPAFMVHVSQPGSGYLKLARGLLGEGTGAGVVIMSTGTATSGLDDILSDGRAVFPWSTAS